MVKRKEHRKKYDSYRYYRVVFRVRRDLTDNELEFIKRYFFRYLEHVPIADIHAKKCNAPSGIVWGEMPIDAKRS